MFQWKKSCEQDLGLFIDAKNIYRLTYIFFFFNNNLHVFTANI